MWRLIIALLLFLLSLLVLFKAPTNFFWRVSVAITEFPYVFAVISFLLFILCSWSHKYKISSLTLSGISFFLYLLPITRAYSRGSDLAADLTKIFPSMDLQLILRRPFSFTTMFTGMGIREVAPQVLTYKTLPEKNLNIDFYPSPKQEKSPCVVVVHGGSWSSGDSKQLPDLNSYLANKGYNVAAINYRLAPKYRSPAPVEDTKDAILHLVKNAEQLNIDTSNFVLLGRSAGGQIALVAAYSLKDLSIKGVVAMYAPADMEWGARIKSNKLVLNTDKVFREYLGGLIDEVPEKYKESSACEYVNKNSPPTLIIHGDLDPMVSYGHSTRLNSKLNDNGVKHYFLNLTGATHGCDYNINGPSGQITTFAIERFINSVTKK